VLSMLSELGEANDISELAARYEARQASDREKLDAMIAYAQSALCRWHLILRQFGESIEGDACGDCDNCRRNRSRQQLPAAS
jgi:ATP-dependent DNA helicase RecQ